MTSPTDPFFKSPKVWSRRKHRLLRKYLTPFVAKVGSQSPLVYCVDGFAGAGVYEDGSLGSPLLMANLADEAASWSHSINLKIINVESDRENFLSLSERTLQWTERGVIHNLHGEFGNLVPEILSEIGGTRALFFIDPFGPTDLSFSSLRPIFERPQRVTELIINFDLDGLRRIADTLYSKAQAPQTRKTVQTNIARVTEILGSDDWKAQFSPSLSSEARESVLLDVYTKNLRKFGYEVVCYPIRKALGDSPKYYLIYCTRHPDGVMLMNDIVRDEEDELLRDSASKPGQLTLPSTEFDAVQQEILQRRELLKELVLADLRRVKKTTRGQIKRKYKFERFGEFHEKDYNSVVQEFVNIGLVTTQHGRKRFNDNEMLTYTG